MALKWLLSSGFTKIFGRAGGGDLHSKAVVSCPNGFVNENSKGYKEMERGVSSIKTSKEDYPNGFEMPVHYPRFSKTDYEKMEEWRIDMLLKEYGFGFNGGTVNEKRAFAMGAFLWPDQL
ncbi:Import inner membrane translocase subunit TIM50-A [Hibiscus syriacus]|uniref:Import inner membrane translocase subunit TIM50-A n=1 Tax=Hibiscus syriacus TaxID=106335 RepID=A0A6A3C920_HIBSY|nr:uncharacterized protein LOC120205283 [Hibiscus syriacus]KAE8723559.1 Import inner membrane translocase subunit TIM50-A [Hibiscus syriacus]